MLCTTLKRNEKFSGSLWVDREGIEHLKWICDLCCLAICIYLYSTLHSFQIKNNKWKFDNQELFERKLAVYFVLHYSSKTFFRKGYDPEIYFDAYGSLTRLGFLCSRTQRNRMGLLPLIANMLFVSSHFSLEKVVFMDSSCCVIFELNKLAFVR